MGSEERGALSLGAKVISTIISLMVLSGICLAIPLLPQWQSDSHSISSGIWYVWFSKHIIGFYLYSTCCLFLRCFLNGYERVFKYFIFRLGIYSGVLWSAIYVYIALLLPLEGIKSFYIISYFLSFVMYLAFSLRMPREVADRPHSYNILRWILGWGIWGLSFILSWIKTKDLADQFYQSLPKTPPDCFIATAAAHGHKNIVQSEIVLFSNDSNCPINDQLRVLKAAELLFKILFPKTHFKVRRIYNYFGPFLAQYIKNRYRADVIYLLLKPAEWMARCIITLLKLDIRFVYNQDLEK